ncbi:MAG TPA: response regulator [Candidatus Binatia bacterium]|nr:response regulator [Candidatus Binatia bacterium]
MRKILVAEDNAINRELLRELLEFRQYHVTEAGDGQQALDLIAQTRPDIVLLDLDMPVLDGFATIAKIRQDPALAQLPVIAVTAYAMRGDREHILGSGFNGYLPKPVDSAMLVAELSRFLQT